MPAVNFSCVSVRTSLMGDGSWRKKSMKINGTRKEKRKGVDIGGQWDDRRNNHLHDVHGPRFRASLLCEK